MRKKNTVQSVLNTSTQYNEKLKEGKINRKKEFLHNHGGWDTVNQAINSWMPEDYPLKNGATQKQVKQAKHDFKKFLKQKQTGIESLFN